MGIPVSRTKIISEEDAALSSEGVMRLPDGRYVQCMPSEYVLRFARPLSSLLMSATSARPCDFLISATCARCRRVVVVLSQARISWSVSVIIQYSALFEGVSSSPSAPLFG